MLKMVLENRKWFGFAVAVAAGISYFFYGRPAPSISATPATETIPLKPRLPPTLTPTPTLIIAAGIATEKNSKPARLIERFPSAQKPPAPDRLMAHALLITTPWKIWLGVKTITAENKLDTDVVLAKLNQLFIIESTNESPNLTEFNSATPIVVYDGRLKKTGLINGLLRIQTTDRAQLEADLIEMHARIADAFEPINAYFVTGLDPIFDLEALYQTLKTKSYIKSTDLDITSRSYEKF